MKNLLGSIAALFLFSAISFSQQPAISSLDLPKAEIDRITARVTQNEGLFRQALTQYAFKRSATVETIGLGNYVTGTYRRDSFLTFTDAGQRIERVLFAPISTLKEITMTAADLENLNGIDPFAIEPSKAANYSFTFLGTEKIDELDLYVFDVSPKVVPNWKKSGDRYFQGRIWVDRDDLMVVKSKGKAIPEGKERFPTIETWRENVDGKYWFPSYSSADDELVFDSGQAVRIKVRVKYSDYKLGRTDVRIVEEDDTPVIDNSKPEPSPTPKKP